MAVHKMATARIYNGGKMTLRSKILPAAVAVALLRWVATAAAVPAARSAPATMPATTTSMADPDLTDPSAATKPAAPGGNDLTDMSLEDLMNVQVTSVSKKKESIADAPAAITVISQDDIARSGFSTIPDLLRLVPGMDVAQI
jgi:outer membrane receptor protein involved in Fe transport